MEAFHGRFYVSGEFREKYVVVEDCIIKSVTNEVIEVFPTEIFVSRLILFPISIAFEK